MGINEENLRHGLNTFAKPGTQRYTKAVAFYDAKLSEGEDPHDAIESTLERAVYQKPTLVNPELKLESARSAAGVTLKRESRAGTRSTETTERIATRSTKSTASLKSRFIAWRNRSNKFFQRFILLPLGTLGAALFAGFVMAPFIEGLWALKYGPEPRPVLQAFAFLAAFFAVIAFVVFGAIRAMNRKKDEDDEHDTESDKSNTFEDLGFANKSRPLEVK